MRLKKFTAIFSIFISIVFFASACTAEREATVDFLSNASKVYVDTKCSSVLSFSVALFSKKQITQVDYIEATGTNVNSDDYDVEITTNEKDVLDTYKYKGLYAKYINIDIFPKESTDIKRCIINSLSLNVDGVVRTLEFLTPIKHEFTGGNDFTESMEISVIPNSFGSAYISNSTQTSEENTPTITYTFYATEDIEIQGIRFDNFLNAENISYCIGETTLIEGVDFPIDVKKNNPIKISFSFSSDIADKQSLVLTNLYFDFITKSDGKSHYNSVVLGFDPVYPISNNDTTPINNIIDNLLQQTEKEI